MVSTPLTQMIGFGPESDFYSQIHRLAVILTPNDPPCRPTSSSMLTPETSSLNPTICLLYNPVSDLFQLPGPHQLEPDFDLRLILAENIHTYTGCDVDIEHVPIVFVDNWRDDNGTREKHFCYVGRVVLNSSSTTSDENNDSPCEEGGREENEDKDDFTKNNNSTSDFDEPQQHNSTTPIVLSTSLPFLLDANKQSKTQTSSSTRSQPFQPPKALHTVYTTSLPPFLTPSQSTTYVIRNLSFTSNLIFRQRYALDLAEAAAAAAAAAEASTSNDTIPHSPSSSTTSTNNDQALLPMTPVQLRIEWMTLKEAVVRITQCEPKPGFYASIKQRDLFFLEYYRKELERMWMEVKVKMKLEMEISSRRAAAAAAAAAGGNNGLWTPGGGSGGGDGSSSDLGRKSVVKTPVLSSRMSALRDIIQKHGLP